MTINISLLLGHIGLVLLFFIIPYYSYRYIVFPNYRWSQKGNVCWENRKIASIGWMFILLAIVSLIYHFEDIIGQPLKIIW